MLIEYRRESVHGVVNITQRERIERAVAALAGERAVDQITLADVAQLAGVHWTTVRRHVGGRPELKALVARAYAAAGQSTPDTRSRILASAAQVFAQHGFDGASIDQVSAEAAMTKGAVYWHFSSKIDLYLAVLKHNVRGQMARWPAEVEELFRTPRPEEAIAAWFAAQLPQHDTDPSPLRLFFEFVSSSRAPAVREPLQEIIREVTEAAAGLVRRLQEQDVLMPDVDPYVVSVYLQALLNGLAMNWLIDPDRVRPTEWAPQLARLLLHGVVRRERRN